MKKQKNKGISLIVLVITIIVMIILAGSIIITISNSGIIGKANEAVDKTNLKQLQEAANVLWLDAYSGGARKKADLETAVLTGLQGIDTSKYNINVTTSGVTVSFKDGSVEVLPELNEYGFYYDQLYAMEADGEKVGFVFRDDGSAECYMGLEELFGTDMFCMQVFEPGLMTYAKGQIGMGTDVATVSSDGLSITMSDMTVVCTFEEVHGIYKGATYVGTDTYTNAEGKSVKFEATSSVEQNNNMTGSTTTTIDGEAGTPEPLNGYVEFAGRNHVGYVNSTPYMYVSADGQKLLFPADETLEFIVLTITEVPENYVEDNTPQLNVNGFYYDQMYVANTADEDGYIIGYVFHRDGSAEKYMSQAALGDDFFCNQVIASGVTYDTNQITYTLDSSTITLAVSDGGAVISDGTITYNYTPMELHGVYGNYGYTTTITENSQEIQLTGVLSADNTITYIQDGSIIGTYTVATIEGRGHIVTTNEGIVFWLSADGMKMVAVTANPLLLTREDSVYTGSLDTSNIIPTGGTYYVGATSTTVGDYTGATETLTAGDTFPSPTAGDVYVYGDYEYRYNYANNKTTWESVTEVNSLFQQLSMDITLLEGWCVGLLDRTKTSYGEILSKIGTTAVVNLFQTFYDCANLQTAPAIPSTIDNMYLAFCGCTNLATGPDMSNATSVTNMRQAFQECASLAMQPDLSNCVELKDLTNTFQGCTGFTTISSSIPSSVTNMNNTYYQCSNLVSGPDMTNATSLTNMEYAFSSCALTTAPDLSNATSLTNMTRAFAGNANLTTVPGTLPTSVTNMYECFNGCTSLTTVPTIPSSVQYMYQMFGNCTSIETVTLATGITSVGEYMFRGCSNLKNVILPNTITEIEKCAFYECTGLSTLTLPESLITIGSSAFNAAGITDITIPSNVKTIGYNAFNGCTKLTSVIFNNTTGWRVTSDYDDGTYTDVDVTSASTNANMFITTYKTYMWYRQ